MNAPGVVFASDPGRRPAGDSRWVVWPAEVDAGFIPSRKEIQRACEHRARKLGTHWLQIGPTECGRQLYQTSLKAVVGYFD